MGRKKIIISPIQDEGNRRVTFNKRKFGLIKKAYELSVLCESEIALIIIDSSDKLYQYASTDMDKMLLKYTDYDGPHESLTNKDIVEQLNKKEIKGGALSSETPKESCVDTEGTNQQIPKIEAQYSKTDEAFQLLMQHQQMSHAADYLLPTSVPVNNMYESGNLQLQHSTSPRPPSSSDADSVHLPGSMLEMKNGYQASSPPTLVNSPSSPGPLVMSLSPTPKALDASESATLSPKRYSPKPNLHIVMPNNAPSYHEESNVNSINTPVVSQNTLVEHKPGLGSSFNGIFTDLTSTTDMGLSSALNWSNQIAPISEMSHIGVPNSPTPNAVHIKSEPYSEPYLYQNLSSVTSETAHNTVISHSISRLSIPYAHSSIPSHHFSVAGGQLPGSQSLVDSGHDFESEPPTKRLRDTWAT